MYTTEPLYIDGPSSGLGSMDDGGDYAIRAGDRRIIGEAIHRTGVSTYEDARANALLWSKAADLVAMCKTLLEDPFADLEQSIAPIREIIAEIESS